MYRNLGLVFIVILAILLGGAFSPWARAIVFGLFALVALTSSPTRRLGKGLTFVLLGSGIWALCSFLPRWVGGLPGWRQSLEEDFGIETGALLSAQPWVSAEAVATIFVGLIWSYFALTTSWSGRWRRITIYTLSLFIGTLGAISLIFHYQEIWPPIWGSSERLGPFPNRNHFASLLAIGGVLSATSAYDLNRRRKKIWPLFLLPLIVVFFTIVVNHSRSGILFLFLGLGMWLVLVSFSSKSSARVGIAASIMTIGIAAFFAFGGELLDRFSLNSDFVSNLSNDGRVPIYLDALRLFAKGPFFGVGAGNFDGVFSLDIVHYWNNDNRPIHPESDWIWLGVEHGFPAIFLVLAGIYFLLRRIGGIRPSNDSVRHQHRLRIGAAIAAMIIPLHGIIDTPGHTIALYFLALILFSLALRDPRGELSSRSFRPASFALGCAVAAVAGCWIAFAYFGVLLPSREGAKTSYAQSVEASHYMQPQTAHRHVSRAIEWAPLVWENYFMRALMGFDADSTKNEVLADFRRARHLEQQWPAIPGSEATFWLEHSPPLALPAWRELLRRDPTRRLEHFGNIIRHAKSDPFLESQLPALADTSDALRIQLLGQLSGEQFEAYLDSILTKDPELGRFDSAQLPSLFKIWHQKGNREELITLLRAERRLSDIGWSHLANAEAEEGDYEAAVLLAQGHLQRPPLNSPDPRTTKTSAEQDFYIHPTDPMRGILAWQLQVKTGDFEAAEITLEKVADLPTAPEYVHLLRAETLAGAGQHREAWSLYNKLIN